MYKHLLVSLLLLSAIHLKANNGYRLWQKYDLMTKEANRLSYQRYFKNIGSVFQNSQPILPVKNELKLDERYLLGEKLIYQLSDQSALPWQEGSALRDSTSIDHHLVDSFGSDINRTSTGNYTISHPQHEDWRK